MPKLNPVEAYQKDQEYNENLPYHYRKYCADNGIPADSADVYWKEGEVYRRYVASVVQKDIVEATINDKQPYKFVRLYEVLTGASVWSWKGE